MAAAAASPPPGAGGIWRPLALVEAGRLGGTCVNVGCVPKKVMWNAAQFVGALSDARGYGFDIALHGHRLGALKAVRDAYVLRLNGIYESQPRQAAR